MRWNCAALRPVALVCLAGLLGACAPLQRGPDGPPVQEMSDARRALQAARSAGGPSHFPDTFRRAEETIEAAAASLGRGDFRGARAAAVSARAQAVAARRAADYIRRLD